MKTNARKRTVDGITFASGSEAVYYCWLRDKEKHGEISGLSVQYCFTLIPAIKWNDGHKERGVKYYADFVYHEKGEFHVVDVKGRRFPEYAIKKKLMKFLKNIEIEEVDSDAVRKIVGAKKIVDYGTEIC